MKNRAKLVIPAANKDANRRKKQQFDRRLAQYALASGALLAAPVAANASIIYSGVLNQPISNGGSLNVSFDGTQTDFTLSTYYHNSGGQYPSSIQAVDSLTAENGAEFDGPDYAGVVIGPGANMSFETLSGETTSWTNVFTGSTTSYYVCGHSLFGSPRYCPTSVPHYQEEKSTSGYGSMYNSEGYFGFEFKRGASTFFGWAELAAFTNENVAEIDLISYAYDNTPGTPITTGAQASPTPEPSAIALFALGAAGICALRRRRLTKQS